MAISRGILFVNDMRKISGDKNIWKKSFIGLHILPILFRDFSTLVFGKSQGLFFGVGRPFTKTPCRYHKPVS